MRSGWEDALAWGVKCLAAHDLHCQGVEAALDLTSKAAASSSASTPTPSTLPWCPASSTALWGLSYYQLVDLIKGAARRGRIEVMDFVEFMPAHDVEV